MDQPSKRFDINDYASAFRKRKWLIVGVTLAALFIGFGITRVTEPMFQARSVLLVKGESRTGLLMTGERARFQEPIALDTETIRAQTMSLAQRAAYFYREETGTAEPGNRIAARLHESLSAQAQEPNIIHLHSTANDPDAAVRYANAAAKAFLDAHRSRSTAASNFIEGQLTKAERALSLIEN
ncbi:MAG: Wzz/FepE/Etk N-terminal domain-containing protein, partial [Armatimonadota bacterium]